MKVTAFASTGETLSKTTSVSITNAEDPLCNYTVLAYPSTVVLSKGKTSETLHVELHDADGKPVSLSDRVVSFTSNNPSIIQIDASGVVKSTGFGEAQIAVTIAGIPMKATVLAVAGEFRVEPPILLLSPNGKATGQLNLKVTNADGSPVNLSGRTVVFSGSNDVAKVNESGVVTALRPPQSFGETPYITAQIDGLISHNAALIRVTSDSLNLNMLPFQQSNISYYVAEQIGTYNYQQIFRDFDVPRITDIAYQEEACGLRPFKGDVQYLVNEPGHGQDGTVPCGISGNPVRLGTDVDKSVQNSCLIVDFPQIAPQWGVFFHELGHNFTLESRSFTQFANASNVGNSNSTYIEGLATAASMYTGQMLSLRANQYQIPSNIVDTILSTVWHFGNTRDLDAYVNGGANYSMINASVLDDIIMVLANKYSYSMLPRFYSVFLPPDTLLPSNLVNSDAKQATFFVAAMSAAAGTDLRADFRNKWGFPIDDAAYNQIYPVVKGLIAQHEPSFTISIGPSSQTISLGSSATFTVDIQSIQGFTQPVSLTAAVSPPDESVNASFSSNTVNPGGSVNLTISTASSTQPSTFTLSITATSGSIVQMAETKLSVVAGPTVTSAVFDGKKKLVISGSRFGTNPRVLINNTDRTDFLTSASDSQITLKSKAKKLGLKAGDNTVQVIDPANRASNVFTLKI